MQKLFIVAALLLCAASAHAAGVTSLGVTFTTASGTKTVTATPAVGDLIVIITAHTGNTSTATPTDDNSAGTYVTVANFKKAASADTMMVHVRTATIGSAVSTIFTHAPGASTGGGLQVFKVTGMTLVGLNAVRQAAGQANQAASGTPAPAFGSAVLTENPTITAVFNATNTSGVTGPTNWTAEADQGYNTPATGMRCARRDSGFTGTTITWGSTSASAFASVAVELASSSAPPVPSLVQYQACPTGNSATIPDIIIYLPNGTQAGNLLVVAGQYGVNASITVSVSDDKTNTWTVNKSGTAGDANQTAFIASAPNVAAGTKKITITFSGANAAFQGAWAGEFNNVATTSPVDLTTSATGSSTTPAAGSITPPVTGDLIVMFAEQDSSGAITSWTAGSQSNITWALAQNDIGFGSSVDQMVQWGVYNSTLAINPSATLNPTGNWNAVAVAFKAAAAGAGQPAGVYVTATVGHNLVSAASGKVLGVPAVGNVLLMTIITIAAQNITAVSDNKSNTWTKIGQAPNNADTDGGAQLWYTSNASPTLGADLTVTITTSATLTSADSKFYVIKGTASSPLDTSYGTSGFIADKANQTVGGNLATNTGAPSTANGIIICAVTVQNNQLNGLVTGNADMTYSTGEATSNQFDENNGKGHFYNPDTSSFTFTWTETAAVGNWGGGSTAFKAPAVAVPAAKAPIIISRRTEKCENCSQSSLLLSVLH